MHDDAGDHMLENRKVSRWHQGSVWIADKRTYELKPGVKGARNGCDKKRKRH